MNTKQQRGRILRDLRIKNGLKQSEIADILGMTQQAYQRYEYGTSEPNADGFLFIADFYGVTTDYLLGHEPLVDPLAAFDVNIIGTDDEAFVDAYKKLPDYAKTIFIDSIKKLAEAAAKERENEPTVSSVECGTLEDAAREKDDISASQ